MPAKHVAPDSILINLISYVVLTYVVLTYVVLTMVDRGESTACFCMRIAMSWLFIRMCCCSIISLC